uniref:NADH-ubiquinone oxidoreductase chain 2 n=1 Tax=Amblyomma nuttalli TaxID=2749712 RepID=A0A977TPV6_9ACAR|nr:NADH dehydrogenase subunit 2 [Amblyomma sparsum]UXX50172.1 NADH dehydrogenase subunit 2 [Amblyomma nuttalli]
MFKNIMKWMLIMTIMITFSSNSWFIFWLMMELNLLMFIPILNFKKKINANCMITYFVIQSFSSALFLISMLNFNIFNEIFFEFLIMISMMIKLAMIPFHFWLTNLSEMIDFDSLFLILSIQKLIPLFIMTFINLKIMVIFAMMSAIFGSLFVFNLKMTKKILIFSSISHQGWMITLILFKSNFWLIYMLIYSFLIMKISFFLKKGKYQIFSDFYKIKKPLNEKILFCSLMLSLGGMPPFLGFIMKLISIIILKSSPLIIILIISSMLNIFIYLRMMNSFLFLNSTILKNFFFNNYLYKHLFININMLISIFIINNLM